MLLSLPLVDSCKENFKNFTGQIVFEKKKKKSSWWCQIVISQLNSLVLTQVKNKTKQKTSLNAMHEQRSTNMWPATGIYKNPKLWKQNRWISPLYIFLTWIDMALIYNLEKSDENDHQFFILFPYSKLNKNILWNAKIWDRVIFYVYRLEDKCTDYVILACYQFATMNELSGTQCLL